jgi:hypothetical protein
MTPSAEQRPELVTHRDEDGSPRGGEAFLGFLELR